MEGRGILAGLHPRCGKLVLPQIAVEGRVTDSYEHALLDGPCYPLCIPIHNGETVHTDAVACRINMLVNGGGSPKILLKFVPKGPS